MYSKCIITAFKKGIIIHVHVPLHCTAWINRESWSLAGKKQAGSFTFLTFNFVLWRAFSCSAHKKKSIPEDNSLQIAMNRSLEHLAFFLFFSCLPSSSSLTFLDRFLGLFSEVERDPEKAEFSTLGWSPPPLSLSDWLPPSGSRTTTVNTDQVWDTTLPVRVFKIKPAVTLFQNLLTPKNHIYQLTWHVVMLQVSFL